MSEMFRAIDEAIVSKIERGRTQFMQLSLNSELEALAKPLAEGLQSPPWRVIDRRLQALRKAGRIAFDRKTGWRVLPTSAMRGGKSRQKGSHEDRNHARGGSCRTLDCVVGSCRACD